LAEVLQTRARRPERARLRVALQTRRHAPGVEKECCRIESSGDVAAVAGSYDRYRCSREFVALCKWLRSHGVESKKPLHTLRKEFGSQIHARYGLLAASEALRHGSVSVTARHYIENRQRSVLGFGHLLKSEERTVVALDKAASSLPEI
jgi:hypothetical protein